MNSKEFLLSLPEKVNEDVLTDLETNFHFVISEDNTTHEITVKVEDGKCIAEEGLHGDANCVVKSSENNLTKILKGELNPMMAILTGKLKISNQGEMLKYAKIFGLM
ncbi:SCP2 sterol-binding domain-containing protein [Membranihabitans maritimus]|uniref:SCP2 sterol-binding domain-containing protein n=1 Tax=Membranihabitans maritimus TaxID=2904244 RepID=UPI001F45E669|nr:SCP2 sterol-binding domain-containing protein [Membranihabitans maritimus]